MRGWGGTSPTGPAALLDLGLGRYAEASAAAARAAEGNLGPFTAQALPDLVEAACRSGQPELAADALRRLQHATRGCDSDWAAGVEARSRALLSEGAEAETAYDEAVTRLARTRLRVELARAQLLYGEWLRREGRRGDARAQLRVGPRQLRRARRRGLRRARPPGAARHRREGPQAASGHAQPAHSAGGAHRQTGS